MLMLSETCMDEWKIQHMEDGFLLTNTVRHEKRAENGHCF